jgi:hypothetical protein
VQALLLDEVVDSHVGLLYAADGDALRLKQQQRQESSSSSISREEGAGTIKQLKQSGAARACG